MSCLVNSCLVISSLKIIFHVYLYTDNYYCLEDKTKLLLSIPKIYSIHNLFDSYQKVRITVKYDENNICNIFNNTQHPFIVTQSESTI